MKEIKKGNEIFCLICNKSFLNPKSFGQHIKCHKIDVKKYYDDYLKKNNNEGSCLNCNKQTNFCSISRGYSRFCSNQCSDKSQITKQKKISTCIKNFGTKTPFQSDRFKNICLQKYGQKNPSQSEQIKNKKIQTSLENYGTDYPLQSKEIKDKLRNFCLEKYGVLWFTQTIKSKRIFREKTIKRIEIQKLNGEPLTPAIGIEERKCLNELEKILNYKIVRNKKIIGYFIDGYIDEINLVIEFDEKHHFINDKLTDRDVLRQKEITDYLHCKFFRIKESDWLQNKELVKEQFLKLCNEETVLCQMS